MSGHAAGEGAGDQLCRRVEIGVPAVPAAGLSPARSPPAPRARRTSATRRTRNRPLTRHPPSRRKSLKTVRLARLATLCWASVRHTIEARTVRCAPGRQADCHFSISADFGGRPAPVPAQAWRERSRRTRPEARGHGRGLREESLIDRRRTAGRCVWHRVAKRNDLPSRDVR